MLLIDHRRALGPQTVIYFSSFTIKGTWMGKGEMCGSKNARKSPALPGLAL